MRHICTRCKLTSVDGNLWCQEVDCPAGTLPGLLRYGDYLGSLKIMSLLRVLKTTTIYKAERDGELFLLKVANPGEAFESYLKREAKTLKGVSDAKIVHSALPVWVQHPEVNSNDPYGIVTFRDQTRYYMLMEYREGEFLSDVLLKNAQPWHEHAGWFTISLAEAVMILEKTQEGLHLNLSPENIMVYYNNLGVPQPILLDFGLQEKPGKDIITSDVYRFQQHLHPAYTPVELVEGGKLSWANDARLLGVLLYEMLKGEPAYPYELRRTEDIYENITLRTRMKVDRKDLPARARASQGEVEPLVRIVERAVTSDHPQRFNNVNEFYNAILSIYGKVPDKPGTDTRTRMRNLSRNFVTLCMVVFIAAVMIMLLVGITT